MAPITPPAFPPVIFPSKPINNVSAFTYRDGETYMQVLERLRRYMNENLVGEFDGFAQSVLDNYEAAYNDLVERGNDNVTAIVEAGNQALAEIAGQAANLQTQYDEFTTDTQEIVDSINNRNGAIPVQHVTLDDVYLVAFDPTWPTNLPRTYHFTQDATGGHDVEWPVGVNDTGAPINPAPGSQTYVTLNPLNDAGTAWVAVSDYAPPTTEFTYNVRDYGAVGDGVTDDRAAFQATCDRAALFDGGTVYVPAGTYAIGSPVMLRDGVSWRGDGAVSVITVATVTEGIIFVGDSQLTPGYGSGPSNFTMSDLKFLGDLPTSKTFAIAQLHHSRNVEFRNIIADGIIGGGHAWDLMGCDTILFDHITVLGSTGERVFTEAIQTDFSQARGFSWVEDPNYTACDGLPTVNVTVQNSTFDRKMVGATAWPCPNVIGTHTAVEGQRIRNITFRNNYVRGWASDLSSAYRGIVKFASGVENLVVEGNTFVNSANASNSIVNQYRGVYLLPMTEIRNPTPPAAAQSSTPIVAKSVTIRGNRLHQGVPGDTQPAIQVTGDWTTDTRVNDVTITDNYLENGNLSAYARSVNSLTIGGNTTIGGQRAYLIYQCDDVTVTGNVVKETDQTAGDGGGVRLHQVVNAAIVGNTFKGTRDPVWINTSSQNITVQGNTFNYTPNGTDGRGVQVQSSSSYVTVTGNVFRPTAAAQFGVRVVDSSLVTIGANLFAANITNGASLSNSTSVTIIQNGD